MKNSTLKTRFATSVPRAALLLAALALISTPTQAGEGINGAAAYEHFKALAGDWVALDAKGKKIAMSYELVGNGSAVLERFGGEEGSKYASMVTLYHLDGNDLVLTHYCMAGNQPRMRARAFDPETGEVAFEMVDATGLETPDEGHMHRAIFRFETADRHSSDWTFRAGGEDRFTETMTMTRVARQAAR